MSLHLKFEAFKLQPEQSENKRNQKHTPVVQVDGTRILTSIV